MNPEFRHLEDNGAVCQELVGEMLHQKEICDKCGTTYGIGCSPWCRDKHAYVGRTHHEFEAYYDEGLGAYIETRDVRKRLLKEANADAKDGMRAGDLSARRDRVEADRAEKRREKLSGRLYFT